MITIFPNHLLFTSRTISGNFDKNDTDSVSLVLKTALKRALRGSGY